MKEYSEFLRRGYILTKDICPKCGKILLKDPKTGLKFCICGYRESLEEVLNRIEGELIKKLDEEKEIKNIYLTIRSIYLIEKLKKLIK